MGFIFEKNIASHLWLLRIGKNCKNLRETLLRSTFPSLTNTLPPRILVTKLLCPMVCPVNLIFSFPFPLTASIPRWFGRRYRKEKRITHTYAYVKKCAGIKTANASLLFVWRQLCSRCSIISRSKKTLKFA